MKIKIKIIIFTLLFLNLCSSVFADSMSSFLKILENSDKDIIESNLIENQPADRFVEKVKLSVLNKITGKTSIINAKIGETINFELLNIQLLKCWKSYPEENKENKLLLKVYENDLKNNKKIIFYGWFFSSAPSISGIEHPLYDLKLIDCEKENSETIINNN